MAKKKGGTEIDRKVAARSIWVTTKKGKKDFVLFDHFVAAQKEEMQKWIDGIADGYNKIVANWEEKPRFRGVVSFHKGTNRFYMRIQVVADRTMRFRWVAIDFGAKRKKKVGLQGIVFPFAEKIPFDAPTEKFVADARYRAGGYMANKNSGNPKEFRAWKKASTVKLSPYEQVVFRRKTAQLRQKQLALAGRTQDPEYMPMRPYVPKTLPFVEGGPGIKQGESGYYPGETDKGRKRGSPVGPGWGTIKYKRQYKMGDIKPRFFTYAMRELVFNRQTIGGAARIWPQNLRKDNMIKRARYRFRQRAKSR
jgi:hypothetical protein